MLTTAEVTQQFLQTIIEIIGRKTSQEYAAVSVRNLLKRLQPTYPFLHDIEIKHTYSLEVESCVNVDESLNGVNPKKVGVVLRELVKRIMESMGKTAGYFFIRETREKIGIDYDTMLTKTMGVDLTLMQSTYIVDKKTSSLLQVQNSDVLRRFLKSLIDAVEKQTSRTYAIRLLGNQIDALRSPYPFLARVSVNDIRYTLGAEEVVVPPEINDADAHDLGRVIQSILSDTDRILKDLGRNSIVSDLRAHFTREYLSKLEEMNVNITTLDIGYEAIFKQTLKALIDIFSRVGSETSAIGTINSFLRILDNTYQFLREVNVESGRGEGEPYHITITSSIDSISETDARRAIQHLLVIAMDSLGEAGKVEFIRNFKDALDKKYLSKIEELGVNFHMIELHQALQTKANE